MNETLQQLIDALKENTEAERKSSESYLDALVGLSRDLASYGRERVLSDRRNFAMFEKTGLSLGQSVGLMIEGMNAGIAKMSKNTVDFVAQTKRLGLGTKSWVEALAYNTEILGMTEDATLDLLTENVKLGQAFHRNSMDMVNLQKSLKDTSKRLAVQGGDTGGFQLLAAQVLAAFGSQYAGATKSLMEKLAGTTIDAFTQTIRVGATGFLGGKFSQKELVNSSKALVDSFDKFSGGTDLPFIYDLWEKIYGFGAEEIQLARMIAKNQNELLKTNNKTRSIMDLQVKFSQTVADLMREFGLIFLPYTITLLRSISKFLEKNSGMITNKLQKVSDWLDKNLSIAHIKEALTGFYKAHLEGPFNWLTSNLTMDKIYNVLSDTWAFLERIGTSTINVLITIAQGIAYLAKIVKNIYEWFTEKPYYDFTNIPEAKTPETYETQMFNRTSALIPFNYNIKKPYENDKPAPFSYEAIEQQRLDLMERAARAAEDTAENTKKPRGIQYPEIKFRSPGIDAPSFNLYQVEQ